MHKNCCHQSCSFWLRYAQNRLSAGALPRPHWGSLQLDQRLGIRCRLTSAIRRVVTSLSDVHFKHSCSLSTSVSSALRGFSTMMRYINRHYLSNLQCSPRPPSWFMGWAPRGKGRREKRGKRRGGRAGERRGEEGMGGSPGMPKSRVGKPKLFPDKIFSLTIP